MKGKILHTCLYFAFDSLSAVVEMATMTGKKISTSTVRLLAQKRVGFHFLAAER